MDFGNHCVTAAERQGQNRATRISRITAALKVSKSDFCKTARLTRNLPVHQPSKFPLRGAPTYPHGRTTAAIIADAGMCGQFRAPAVSIRGRIQHTWPEHNLLRGHPPRAACHQTRQLARRSRGTFEAKCET